jgi:hypothetical protein
MALCDQELPVVRHWQPPAPQRGLQAALAEKVRRELWALRVAWVQAMNASYGYLEAVNARPNNLGMGLAIPAPSVVSDAAAKVRALETRLRREWGLS